MRLLLAALVLAVAGCGGSAVMRAADAGDMTEFRSSLNERLKGEEVELAEAKDIAARLMQRQIQTAQGPSGLRTLDNIEACAMRFERSLAHRAAQEDELAARAALLRIEVGMVPPMAYAEHVDHRDAYWRAAAARSLGLQSPRPGEAKADDEIQLQRAAQWRRKLMADPARDVRVAALRAAVEAGDPGDVGALLETARLDPFPLARRIAIQACGAVGSREAVLGLKDIWTGADEEVRIAIVEAWAAAWRKPHREGEEISCGAPPHHPSCEGHNQLQRVAEQGKGMPSLMAALELIHYEAPNKATAPAAHAAAVVERFIDDAATRIRVEAIASAPLSWAHLLEAVVEASKSEVDEVAVAALARMTELTAKERDDALKKLRKLAKTDRPAADAAKLALVTAQDGSVVKLLDVDAKSKSGHQRGLTAARYAKLGQVGKVLSMLGDKDAKVRSQAVCAILHMSED